MLSVVITVRSGATRTTLSPAMARTLFFAVLGRDPTIDEFDELMDYAEETALTPDQFVAVLGARTEKIVRDLDAAQELHLFALHRARVAAIAALLPPADRILDLGGANAPLNQSGYPHSFGELILVDLLPSDRHLGFANRVCKSKQTDQGLVSVLYTNMTDLSAIADATIDLVWSGESIEHISRSDAHQVYGEVRRVLRPGGSFCLDTPNALVTRIHSPDAMIHPDHKIEYTPAELIGDLEQAGFAVVRSFGICDMPLTVASGSIDYRDFLVGAGLSSDLGSCYIQYHECRIGPEPKGYEGGGNPESSHGRRGARVGRMRRGLK